MLRRKCRYLITVLLAAALLLSSGMGAYAASEAVDFSKTGSVSVALKYGEAKTPVAGGTLVLYRVADAVNQGGNLAYEYTDTFKNCGLSLEDPDAEGLAAKLASWAAENVVSGTEQTVGDDGTTSFTDLSLGIYLLTQGTAASGYEAISPFIVGIPMEDAETSALIYAVDASPKVELTSSGTDGGGGSSSGRSHRSSGGSSSSSGGGSSSYTTIGDGETPQGGLLTQLFPEEIPLGSLPQTGQLNWPIPVLAISGLLLFAYGWWLSYGKRRNEVRYEQ